MKKHDTITARRFLLVYQAGIANLFEVNVWNLAPNQRESQRIAQSDFCTCENIAYGLALGGHCVASVGCNIAGNCENAQFTADLANLPFSDKFHPVFQRGSYGAQFVTRKLDG